VLSESSYFTAMYVYLGSAGILIAYVAWWLSRHWRPAWVTLVVLLMAALLLTPAYPKVGVETMAPALVVAAFQFLTAGVEGVVPAIRPLIFMCGIAVVATLLLRMTVFRRRKTAKPKRARNTPETGPDSAARV
jgi:hypothetical protein